MVTLTPSAQQAISRFIEQAGTPLAGLRISVSDGGCSGHKYAMQLETQAGEQDLTLQVGEVTLLVDPESQPLLEGCTVDFVESLEESGFKFSNPNAKAACNCGKSFAA
ncbi:HesB/IscA family protein [Marinospirillum perlucidum]|uniref:HesB/IscA family protein n=1 Tax=Marinospirillum perlucidum TaxID=1982602 RepID=UPI000DF4307F|nr:iron-sulfur cluster assembly accessory protein [Marinospirillum perlucidum]